MRYAFPLCTLTVLTALFAAIDLSGWPVAQQVDYHLVRAEMNGLDFDHRVRRPWARNPAFYAQIFPSQSDVPAREGPVTDGAIELWTYASPLSAEHAADLTARLQTVPGLLDQARGNLVEDARDLWLGGLMRMESQRDDLAALADRVAGSDAALEAAVTEYMAFLEESAIVSIRDYMDAALRARIGRFSPADGLRGFFSEVNYRDPLVMRTHHYHWFDLARMAEEPHASPIRQKPLLYNIFDGRAEGLATGDDLNTSGVIPVSLIRWEITGLDDEVTRLWKSSKDG